MRLEAHYRDMCDTEFTIEQGKLWMLQTRIGKRTGVAALKMAVDMTKGTRDGQGGRWKISRDEAILRVSDEHLDSVLHPQFANAGKTLATGLGASPGAAVGKVYFTADDAVDADERGEARAARAQRDQPRGRPRHDGRPGHPDRPWRPRQPCGRRRPRVGHPGRRRRRGDQDPAASSSASATSSSKRATRSRIDGTTGTVVLGAMDAGERRSRPPSSTTMLKWADQVRKGKLAVRANADTGEDAANARELGAEGIGLCRTEHMFLAPDRLPIVREMILASTPKQEAAALEKLRVAQEADFTEVLDAMDGLPVTIRLLDPPLHEFLPSVEELRVKQAKKGKLSKKDEKMLEAAEAWAEHNPMIGTRGVRLGVIKPGLYAMQVRALLAAAAKLRDAGKKPIVEIMIPLTVTREELALARSWVQEEIDTALAGMKKKPIITIGTMIETPRAAIRADEMAEVSDFFSFGTNDLTQLTFGFSRDDVESRMMPAYLEQGLLKRNPFDTIDQTGVGDLVRLGAERGRATKPDLKLGVCGEHGGDPESIDLFYRVGLDYVSCSPFRVPIARLSAAQAILNNA